MSLEAGSRLGAYEVAAPIGAGGMGVVYRARDTRLARDVAIKVLPAAFTKDADRVARFRREAQLLASLNHPNVAAIYGLEEAAGVVALVLELVEGEDLAQRLAGGEVPVDEAIGIARQIAEGLEAAHEKGIVHRDLKPANVKVSPSGMVKLLDFGLAKLLEESETGASAAALSVSPTLTGRATAAGMILGTAAYMSPEQARGKAVDRRTDVWAFGCVLYEMLAGKRAFEGDSVSDTLAAVLMKEPDWTALPDGTPAAVRRLLRRCLQRDARARLHDVADARLELEEIVPGTGPGSLVDEEPRTAGSRSRPGRGSARLAWTIAAAGLVLAATFGTLVLLRPPRTERGSPRRLSMNRLSLDFGASQSLAISPDGSRVVYRGRGEDGFPRLFVRSLDEIEERPIPGTEEGAHPFFSPDGASVGFFANHVLKKVALAGGTPQLICPAKGQVGGGTWLPDDTIVFSGDTLAGLDRVAASGGTPKRVLSLDQKTAQLVVSPWALPGGKAVLCAVRTGEAFATAVFSLGDGSLRILANNAYAPVYVSSGYVVFHQERSLLALPFDVRDLRATGSPFPVLTENYRTRIANAVRLFAVAGDGTLVYAPGRLTDERSTLAWIDRRGTQTPIVEIPWQLDAPRLSPDGTKIAFRQPSSNCDIWIHDLARATMSRLTLEGDNHGIAWSPDGRHLAFCRLTSSRGGTTGILSVPADGSTPPRLVIPLERGNWWPGGWSPDGKGILAAAPGADSGWDLNLVSLGAEPKVETLVKTPFDESQGVFSRDGRYLAYVSNESGRDEVYVQPFPALDARVQASTGGGSEPVWARSGRELFFRQGRKLIAVDVETRGTFAVGLPHTLFEADIAGAGGMGGYDVSLDGERFLVVKHSGTVQNELAVVLGWTATFRQPAGAEAKR